MSKPKATANTTTTTAENAETLDASKEITTTATETAVANVDNKTDVALFLSALNDDPNENDFGESFGGTHERLILVENSWSKGLSFQRFETITTATDDNGDATESFRVPLCKEVLGMDADGKVLLGAILALPAGATLKRTLKDAEIGAGDVFRLNRGMDTAKKTGKGKGQMMEVYGIRVLLRS